MAASQKKGGGSKKIGRHKRAASNAAQRVRSAVNAERRHKRNAQRPTKRLRVPRGTARALRRAAWATARVSEMVEGKLTHKPTFAEFSKPKARHAHTPRTIVELAAAVALT